MGKFSLLVVAASPVLTGRLRLMIDDALERIGSEAPEQINFGCPEGDDVQTSFLHNVLPHDVCIIFVMGQGHDGHDDVIVRWLIGLPEAFQERTIFWWNCGQDFAESKRFGIESEYNIYSPTNEMPTFTIERALRKFMRALPAA